MVRKCHCKEEGGPRPKTQTRPLGAERWLSSQRIPCVLCGLAGGRQGAESAAMKRPGCLSGPLGFTL